MDERMLAHVTTTAPSGRQVEIYAERGVKEIGDEADYYLCAMVLDEGIEMSGFCIPCDTSDLAAFAWAILSGLPVAPVMEG